MQRNLFSRLWISPFLLFSTLTIANEKVVQQPTIEQANTFINDSILPPIQAWSGASEALLLSPEHPWATPFEQQNYQSTPNYQDTMAWLDNLVDSSDLLHKVSLGKSPQGRDIWMIVASAEGAQTAKQLGQNGKATVLVQAGIHSGEIDGKDAGMMLLRDISHGNKRTLLENVNLLFVPILSVDAHERSSEYNRVNQRGPINMGWRTTANNLNLNRDYAKADDYFLHSTSLFYDADSWTVGAGIRNVFNKEPPVVDGSEVLSYSNTPIGYGYDLQGRTFFFDVVYRMGGS